MSIFDNIAAIFHLEERRSDFIQEKELTLIALKEGKVLATTFVTNNVAVGLINGCFSGITEILENDKAKKSLGFLINEVAKLKKDGYVTSIVDEANKQRNQLKKHGSTWRCSHD